MLGSHVWTELKSLRLDGLNICETGLNDLLMRHRSTLEHLDLYNICLEHGSFRSLLSHMRSTLSLKQFQMWGYLLSRHSPQEDWFLPPTRAPDTHMCPGMDYYQQREYGRYNQDKKVGIRKEVALALKYFVLHAGQWPMNTALKSLADLEFSDLKCDEDDVGDIEFINNAWDNLAKLDDLKTWEICEYDYEIELGVGDIEDVMQIFDDDDLDTNGFNCGGLDEEGVHFETAFGLQPYQ